MLNKISQLFSRKKEPGAGMKKISGFVDHLKKRGIVDIVVFDKVSKKWKIAGQDAIFQASRYYIIANTGDEHGRLADHLRTLGVSFFEQKDVIIGGTDLNYRPRAGKPLRVAALMHVFNEADILPETIRHLLDQGVHVHLIDNWSTDGSWEIAERFSPTEVSRERFPAEGPSDHYEWYKQLEYSGVLADRLDYDWFLHYDADELRYSPWKDVRLRDAIGFIDDIGYNAIDFTILDFRYTPDNDQVKEDFEKRLSWFELGRRPGHFLQVKGWKKQAGSINLHDSGGHDIQFQGRKVYPLKFLTKHYSLRSKEQAIKKLVEQRLPRVQKELSERSWHSHIELLIAQQSKGWEKKDLIEWNESSFYEEYMIERLSGVGIDPPQQTQ